mmetsp:Transcript_31698/g.78527  ORF Transcript_31698/g.78527 Transcript_31698/m.78527 type:complete len:221 (-) Transcript_31698:1728-2390(-)
MMVSQSDGLHVGGLIRRRAVLIVVAFFGQRQRQLVPQLHGRAGVDEHGEVVADHVAPNPVKLPHLRPPHRTKQTGAAHDGPCDGVEVGHTSGRLYDEQSEAPIKSCGQADEAQVCREAGLCAVGDGGEGAHGVDEVDEECRQHPPCRPVKKRREAVFPLLPWVLSDVALVVGTHPPHGCAHVAHDDGEQEARHYAARLQGAQRLFATSHQQRCGCRSLCQ